MIRILKKFQQDECGAVTVDFVVLTAAVALLGAAIGFAITNGATSWADKAEKSLSERPLGTDWVN